MAKKFVAIVCGWRVFLMGIRYFHSMKETIMISNTRLTGRRFDSRIQKLMDAEWALTLTMRIYLEQVSATSFEHKDVAYPCKPWDHHEWSNFCRDFKRVVEKVWNRKLWLKPPSYFSDFDFPATNPNRRPNLTCRLEIEIMPSAAGAHHRLRVVRLTGAKGQFRSNSGLITNYDTQVVASNGVYVRVTAVHEVGHLLGLGHPGKNFYCQIDPSDEICYSDYSVMGKGISVDARCAEPWQLQTALHTNTVHFDWTALTREEPAMSLISGWY